jgi:RNA polymerase sigma-70 factor (ECF subfamily)
MTDFAAGSRHHATQSLSSSPSPQNTRALLPRSHLLEALYRDERAGVLAYLKRKIGHEHANDLAQEVFLRSCITCAIRAAFCIVSPGTWQSTSPGGGAAGS